MGKLHQLRTYLLENAAALSEREAQVRAELDEIFSSFSGSIPSDLVQLGRSINEHRAGYVATVKRVHKDMDEIALRASSLSDKVRMLDHNISELSRAKAFVTGVEEIGSIEETLRGYVDRKDFSAAVEIVKRVNEYEALGVLGVVEPAKAKSITQLNERLIKLIRAQFEADKKSPAVQTMCKMMFTLGKKEEALAMYMEYVRSSFSDRCQSHLGTVYSSTSSPETPVHLDAVTNIFLEVADVVQRHQRTIDTEFGESSFKQFVTGIEQDAHSYAARIIHSLIKNTNGAMTQIRAGGSEAAIHSLDFSLEEIVTIVMRCKQFGMYIRGLVEGVTNDQMERLVEEIIGVYVAGEQALLHALFGEAMRDDTIDESDMSKTSSIIDDAFFIFKKCMNRSILSTDPNCACAIVNNITNLIQADLREYLETSFGSAKRLFSFCIGDTSDNPCESIFKHRREEQTTPSTRITSADSLPHAMSNIALAWSYVSKFKQDCLESFDESFKDKAKARSMFQQCLLAFDVCVNELNELHVSCAKYILVQCRAVYISPHISAIDAVDFNITDAGFADFQINDPYMRAFVASLEALIKWIRSLVSPDCVRVFFILLSDYIAIRLERTLFQHSKSKFSILGATQFYQDLARMVSFIASATEVPVRNKYGRLQELASIMCVESVAEYKQIYGDGSTLLKQFKITPAEVKALLSMRSDLSADSVSTIS